VGTGLIQYLALLLQPAAVVVRGIALREQPHLVVLVVVGHLLLVSQQIVRVEMETPHQPLHHKGTTAAMVFPMAAVEEEVALVRLGQILRQPPLALVAMEEMAGMELHHLFPALL
jgi:hypothetical protein